MVASTLHNAVHKKQHLISFLLSLLFLPLPVLLGGKILGEAAQFMERVTAFGMGAGDWLLAFGMGASLVFLVGLPLACFAWGQVLAWSYKEETYSMFLVYTCLSIAYTAVSITVLYAMLGRWAM